MGVTGLGLVLTGTLIFISQMRLTREKMAMDHVLRARMVANNCLAAVSFNDSEDASLVLRTLANDEALAYASVVKMDGTVLATYRRGDFVDEPQPHPLEQAHAFLDNWLIAQEPILLDGEIIGTAFLQSDLRDLAFAKKQVFTIVAGNLLIVFLLSCFLSSKLLRFVSTPIEHLTDIMKKVSQQRDYSIRAPEMGNDEMGVLSSTFNKMLAELEKRNEQLKEREHLTRAYLDVAGVMILTLAPDGSVRLINPRGCEILGLEEEQVIDQQWFERFVPERIRQQELKTFNELIDGHRVPGHESHILTGNGEERLILWRHSVIADKSGTITAILSSGADITARREAEKREKELREKLVRSERMESIVALAGGVAHDLNNILGPIVMLPELIQEELDAAAKGDAAAKADILDSLDVLHTSAQRAATVVKELLALSKRGHYERSPMDINRMPYLSPDCSAIKPIAESHQQVRIIVRPATMPLVVLASEDHLCRVIDNLVRNATEAIDGAGQVSVTTDKKVLLSPIEGYCTIPAGTYAVIEVKDTGKGIEKTHLSRIFEPFYTQKRLSDNSGSGLGLSIVHGIIDDHDGFIDVSSTVGKGTTFTVYLPLTNDKGKTETMAKESSFRGTGNILVVDDEPGQRFLAQTCLKRWGFEVSLAADGRSAAEAFSKAHRNQQPSPFRLVMLDMRMEPGFDGLDTLNAIRACYPEQPVLIASGHAEDDRVKAALALGAKWLSKPYSLNALAASIREMLDQQAEW